MMCVCMMCVCMHDVCMYDVCMYVCMYVYISEARYPD